MARARAEMTSALSGLSRSHMEAWSNDLARQIVNQLSAWGFSGAPDGAWLTERALVFEVDLGGQIYLLTCRPHSRPLASLGLSPREKEIVRLVAKGLPNKAIAQVLDISLWTVATHVRRVFTKVAVSSRAEMIAKILQEGLLEPASDLRKPSAIGQSGLAGVRDRSA
jgi:DNA-binding CsgD family transcriptional regulator